MTSHSNESALNPIRGLFFLLEPLHPLHPRECVPRIPSRYQGGSYAYIYVVFVVQIFPFHLDCKLSVVKVATLITYNKYRWLKHLWYIFLSLEIHIWYFPNILGNFRRNTYVKPSGSVSWIWANQPILHLFLVGCLNPCLQGANVQVVLPHPISCGQLKGDVNIKRSNWNNQW